MRWMTSCYWQPSTMELVLICSFTNSTIKTHKPWLNSSIQPNASWMERMQSLLRKGRELNEWKKISHAILNRVLVQRQPGQEKRKIKTIRRQVHLQQGASTIRPWTLHLNKCFCKSRMTRPWSVRKKWKEIPTSVIGTSIAASTKIMGMTRTNILT